MLNAYIARNGGLAPAAPGAPPADVLSALWIDVVNPSPDDDKRLLAQLGIDIPTRDEMQEIEPSSRLYEQDGGVYMTALVTWDVEEDPKNTAVAFVVTANQLVTVRFAEPQPFRSFAARVARQPRLITSSDIGFVTLMEIIVDRAADLLERCGAELDMVSADIFREKERAASRLHREHPRDLEVVLQRIGRQYNLASKVRESLVSLGRAVAFFHRAAASRLQTETDNRLRTIERDLRALAEHDTYLSQKTNFLLDATLGLINNDQNRIIKIFSVVSVVFLPPTLVASIYGMNFKLMPELGWDIGYPWALMLMFLSAVVPYWYFKRRGWL